jgi:hypothetical protein
MLCLLCIHVVCPCAVSVWCIRPQLYLVSTAGSKLPLCTINIVAHRKISYAPTKLYGVKYQKTAVVTAPYLIIVVKSPLVTDKFGLGIM